MIFYPNIHISMFDWHEILILFPYSVSFSLQRHIFPSSFVNYLRITTTLTRRHPHCDKRSTQWTYWKIICDKRDKTKRTNISYNRERIQYGSSTVISYAHSTLVLQLTNIRLVPLQIIQNNQQIWAYTYKSKIHSYIYKNIYTYTSYTKRHTHTNTHTQ